MQRERKHALRDDGLPDVVGKVSHASMDLAGTVSEKSKIGKAALDQVGDFVGEIVERKLMIPRHSHNARL